VNGFPFSANYRCEAVSIFELATLGHRGTQQQNACRLRIVKFREIDSQPWYNCSDVTAAWLTTPVGPPQA